MKLAEIHIRDPYILPYNGVYYMYGAIKSKGMKFFVYKSKDLIEWSSPETVFDPPVDFWADRDFWAPEVHLYKGKFYMFATFKAEGKCRGTQILVSDTPDGKFTPLTAWAITPADWECLDGTFYVDKGGKPHMVFCHEWLQIGDGTICDMALSEDLTSAVTEPRVLWKASDYKEVVDVLPNKTSKVTDGPFLHRLSDGQLICIWSSFNSNGYAELISRSSNGDIDGVWEVDEMPLMRKNGGHGMIFQRFDGVQMLVMHSPNESPNERAVMYDLKELQ